MQGRAARGWAEIAGSSGDWRKHGRGNAALLREQRNEARIRLVRRKTANGAARNAAAQLDRCKNFLHAGDRRARQRFAVKLHLKGAILRIADLDGGSVLARATKNKFAEKIAFICAVGVSATEQECACAVAEEAAEFAGHAARSERSAVNIRSDNQDSLGLSSSDQRLRDGKGVEQSEAGASDVERAAILAGQQSRMKLRRKRGIIVMRFAGDDDPIQFLRSARTSAQRLFRGPCPERKFVFAVRSIGERFDASAVTKLADRHPEGAINVLGCNDTRTYSGRRGRDDGQSSGMSEAGTPVRKLVRAGSGMCIAQRAQQSGKACGVLIQVRTEIRRAACCLNGSKKTDPAHGIKDAGRDKIHVITGDWN